MKRILVLAFALGAAFALSACETPQQQNALVGARSARAPARSSVRLYRGAARAARWRAQPSARVQAH